MLKNKEKKGEKRGGWRDGILSQKGSWHFFIRNEKQGMLPRWSWWLVALGFGLVSHYRGKGVEAYPTSLHCWARWQQLLDDVCPVFPSQSCFQVAQKPCSWETVGNKSSLLDGWSSTYSSLITCKTKEHLHCCHSQAAKGSLCHCHRIRKKRLECLETTPSTWLKSLLVPPWSTGFAQGYPQKQKSEHAESPLR